MAPTLARVVLAAALTLVASTRASALCFLLMPDPLTSTTPDLVLLLGRDGSGQPDPRGEFVVIVRNGCGFVLGGQLVEISFLGCGATRFASTGYPAGVTPDCGGTHRSVRRLSDSNGEARFNIPGTALVGGEQAPSCAQILVEGRSFGFARLALGDLDGSDGVTASDLSALLQAFIAGNASQADLDGDGSIGAGDLSAWLDIFAAGGSLATPSPLCP